MVFNFLIVAGIFIFLYFLKGNIESKFYDLGEQIKLLTKTVESLKDLNFTVAKSADEITQIETKKLKIPTKVFTESVTKPIEEQQQSSTIEEIEEIEEVEIPILTKESPKQIEIVTKPIDVPYVAKPSFWENFKENNPDLEKFVGENLISKIGILILVLGISYFVKYSIDQGWISEPLRVAIGMLAGSLVLGVAHKLRQNFAAFSSVFVAGAVAIFYFTIAIAFHDYKLFSQEVAFGIMVVITSFAALITIFYNRLELGILTLIGGFAVPFMVSTGAGNFVVLFSYILILDIGILCIAYFKKWDVLNLLAFIFTTILFGSWLFIDLFSSKPHYAGALLFGFLFYLLFCIINIVNNFRTKTEFSLLQMGVISANTFLFYAAGMSILNSWHPELRGLFTAAIAIFNLSYAYFIFKKFGADKKVLYLLVGLTLTFITLSIPIQFSGHYITMFWAAEAVMLLWLAQKSNVANYKLCSIIVHGLMLFSLIIDWYTRYTGVENLNIITNPVFLTGLISVISYFLSIQLLKSEKSDSKVLGLHFNPIFYSKIQYILGLIVAYFVGLLEISHQSNKHFVLDTSAQAIVWFYHLFFSAILCFILLKKQFQQHWIVAIIAICNVVLFTFYISNFAFTEHKNFIATGNVGRLAFYTHYFSLVLTIYFAFIIYKMYKNNELHVAFSKSIFAWIGIFFIVYIASTELLIHGLIFSNSPVTMADLLRENPNGIEKDSELWIRNDFANAKIESVRTTIFKSGMPVLWGALSFLFLIIGIRKPSRILRIMALSLLGLTILKLFLYDIRNASETGRIIAFILLGVLILIISFVYQKLKILVNADTNPSNTADNE